ncbi:MAG: hypothetical protein HWD59_12530 [Coxiellaceae bacterium]|nr:MAG: hypothetical protein HWD59_12530 [Coxiellaceae bacterium]
MSVAGKKGKLGLIELIMRNDSRWNLVNSTNKQNRGPLEETMRSGSINAFKQILKFQSGIFVMDSIHKSVFLSLVTQSQPGYEPYFVAYIAF